MNIQQQHALSFFRFMENKMSSVCNKMLSEEPKKTIFNVSKYRVWLETMLKAKEAYEYAHVSRLFAEYSVAHVPVVIMEVDDRYKGLFVEWFARNQLEHLPIENTTKQ